MPESHLQTEWPGQFGRGLWHYTRPRFAFAGQDSFTDPPSQNEDMFEQLLNVMPPVQGDLDRRWGYRAWNTSAPQGAASAQAAYPTSIWSDQSNTIRYIVESTLTGQTIYTETGQTSYLLTYTGAPGVRSTTSNGVLYSTDGVLPKKWTPALGTSTQNWGIDINAVSGGTNGPNAPSTATDLGLGGASSGSQGPKYPSVGSSLGIGTSWSSPGNIVSDNGLVAFCYLPSLGTSADLAGTGFGFSIPGTATVTGIVLEVKRDADTANKARDNGVHLTKDGTSYATSNKATSTHWPLDSPTYATYGSSTDLWGTTWTPTEVNAAAFGAMVSGYNEDASNTVLLQVDDYRITIYYTLPGMFSWTSPNNILANDGAVATATASTTPTSYLKGTNFGFALGAGQTILGIQVDVKCATSSTPITLAVSLVKSGAAVGTLKTVSVTSTSLGFLTLGDSGDLWGTGWTAADLNAATSGVQFEAYTSSGSATISVDFIRITVYTMNSGITIGAFSGTGVTLISGRVYTYCFYNSQIGPHYSSVGPFTASTGPVTNQSIPLSTIPVCTDSQVDRKKVLATADGGDETTLYEIADLANATTTFTDNIPEATLLLNNQWQATLSDGSEVGLINNSPPPSSIATPVLHRGRMYALVGPYLFYSKSTDELVTPTGVIAGNFEESWPGLNFFPITANASQGRGLLSDGSVLYIGTDRRIIRLFGDGPSTFLQPQVLFDNVGVLNQDVWKLVLVEGNPVGAMWLSPDYRVLGSDFNTYQDVGTPVQDVLNTINVAAIKTAWAANVNISVYNLYVLAVPTGSATQPNTLLVFDLKGKHWFTWQLTDTVVGGFWWVNLNGLPQFIIQAATGKLYVFDTTVFQDRIGDTPVNYSVSARTSWLPLGDSTAYKQLNEIEIGTADNTSGMTLTVEGASSIQDFFSPRAVVTNAPLVQKPRGPYGVFLAGASTRDRYYRFTFNFADGQTDLLRSFNVQGRILNRL